MLWLPLSPYHPVCSEPVHSQHFSSSRCPSPAGPQWIRAERTVETVTWVLPQAAETWWRGDEQTAPPPPTTPGHPGEGLTVLMGNGRFSGPFRQNPRMCQGNALRLELKHPPTSPPVQGLSKLPRGQLLGLPGLSSQLFTGELEQNNGSLKRNPGHSLWERWRHLGQGLRMGKIKLRR